MHLQETTAPATTQAPAGYCRHALPVIAIIVLAFLSALVTGLIAPEPMIGDEVTHYYLLTHQAEALPKPTVEAHIPHATGRIEIRHYPHVFLWHYAGAIVYRLCGEFPLAVQVYHALFWLQFLIAAWALARMEFGANNTTSGIYLLTLASIPMFILLAVGLYQDIPVTAQVLTAFCLLRKRRLATSLLFMLLAFSIKITAILFIPPYLLATWFTFRNHCSRPRLFLRLTAAAIGLILACAPMAIALQSMGWKYYPQIAARQLLNRLHIPQPKPTAPKQTTGTTTSQPGKTRNLKSPTGGQSSVIANSPGDLRIPSNLVVYGGGILWLVIAMATLGSLPFWKRKQDNAPSTSLFDIHWTTLVGVWFAAVTAFMLWTSPDVRFFAPAIPFLLIPIARSAARLPWRHIWLPAMALAAILQSAAVLYKVTSLRHIPAGITDAIQYLKAQPPSPNRLFMYPEGNYRLFPSEHEWYLGYHLREFWKASNDDRITMLHKYKIGAIAIKKHLVGRIDPAMNNLGVYPDFFVKQIEADPRFVKLLDNPAVTLYSVPMPSNAPPPTAQPPL